MGLAVRAKEEYLIGNYGRSLDTFRAVSSQITSYTASLTHEMEHGDASNFEQAEKLYSQWQKTLQLLQEEFALVKQIQEACSVFERMPGEQAPSPYELPRNIAEAVGQAKQAQHQHQHQASLASQSAADAAQQAAHLHAQRAIDVRDPDVWPPPTPVEPQSSAVKRRQPSNQWNRPRATPMKPTHLSRDPSQESGDDSAPVSNRLPAWASRPAHAAPAAGAPVNKPRVRRNISQPPPNVTAAAAEPTPAPIARKRASMAPRKPAVPTAGRKKRPTKDSSSASASSNADDGTEDGGEKRVKFEAATKDEQEMADMIEREILDKKPNVKMSDIAGLAGAKQLLTEAVVLPRLIPGYFTGKRKPWKGVLMFGPPGTGKTLLAKAVATECGTTFFNVSPATVTSKFRGDSEKLMKLLFDMARFYAPSTIFMDEVDGLCSARGGGGEHEASRRVKGEILQQMDGATAGEYDPAKSVIVLGATNLPWELDHAFLRRFEKRVHIDLPDAEGRAAMFAINTEGMLVDDDVKQDNWKYVVDLSEGYSGADIAVVCNDASMLGLRRLLAGKTPEEMKKMDKDEFNVPISRADFESVFATVKSSAAKQDLEKYREWMKEYGSAI